MHMMCLTTSDGHWGLSGGGKHACQGLGVSSASLVHTLVLTREHDNVILTAQEEQPNRTCPVRAYTQYDLSACTAYTVVLY
jgi:hypothetical protein